MKAVRITIAACALLCALAGCKKFTANVSRGDGLIRVSVSSEEAKATLITDSYLKNSYKKFSLDAYVEQDAGMDALWKHPAGMRIVNSGSIENVTKQDDGNWTIAGSPTWITTTPLSFWAAIGVSIDNALETSGLTASSEKSTDVGPHWDYDYTVPSDVASQTDVIMAYSKKEYLDNGSDDGVVDIHFYHALASIRVCISPDDNSFDVLKKGSLTDHNVIKKIVIKNVATSGECNFRGNDNSFIWPDDKLGEKTGVITLTTGTGGTPVALADGTMTGWTKGTYQRQGESQHTLFTCDEQIMMIPQLLTGDAVMEIYMNDNSKPLTASIARYKDGSALTLEAGKYYNFKLNYSCQGDEVQFTATLDSWNEKSVDVTL